MISTCSGVKIAESMTSGMFLRIGDWHTEQGLRRRSKAVRTGALVEWAID